MHRGRQNVGWDSLPFDIVSHIADNFLASNDVDCYMNLRAVCRDWRSATDDPRDIADPRFRPRQWIVMDVDVYGDSRLLLNTATGRFLRRDDMMAHLLRSHRVIAVAADSFLVLADKDSPCSGLRVVNPLTGHSIPFKASLPTNVRFQNVAAVLGSSPTLVLCDMSGKLYRADPDSECFVTYTVRKNYPVRQFIANGVYDLTLKSLAYPRNHQLDSWPFLMKSGGETLAIVIRHHRVDVFNFGIDAAGGNNEFIGPVKSIGGRAIFVGSCRCLSVDADKFPTIDPDCIYYLETVGWNDYISSYDMKKEKTKRIIGFPRVTDNNRPYTIIQLLSSYTYDLQILTDV